LSTIQHDSLVSPVLPRRRSALIETRKRSIAKTISWRAIGSLDTMMVSFLVYWFMHPNAPGEIAKCAGFVGLFEIPNKLLLFYLHERLWSRIGWGLAAQGTDYEI
jgi:uncharacterized membrane protein